nr:hypothetical protein [Mycobacterium sp. UM_NZ2]
MTSAKPGPGMFVTPEDVIGRFEGNFPKHRIPWLALRIGDVENELIGEVPSLAELDVNADPKSPNREVRAAARRVGRVRTLVIDKLLDLFRNPDGATTVSDAHEGISSSRSYAGRQYAGTGETGISFTEAELNRVRVRKPQRPKIGNYGVSPWGIP